VHHLTHAGTPLLANMLFMDGSIPPTARFAELFSCVMMMFDLHHVEFLQQFVSSGVLHSCLACAAPHAATGGVPALKVMQFNPSRKAFAERLSTLCRTESSIASTFSRALVQNVGDADETLLSYS
jgi:prepilin-type processing-associated H-X9-DG protein